MYRYGLSVILWSVLVFAVAALVACSLPAAASIPPDEVVAAFYRWYLGYPGNVLSDRAYHDSEYLSDPYKAEADEIIGSFSGGAYDPFLMAQDIPAEIIVQDVQVRDNRATVSVEQKWTGGFTRELEVELQLIDSRWLISGVIPPEISVVTPLVEIQPVMPPEAVVQEFYTWYLDYIGGGEALRNPLVDGAYRTSPHLTPELLAQIDDLISSNMRGGHDPFLCAQDIPDSIAVGEPIISGNTASVPVSTSLQGGDFEISLAMLQNGWKINAINCEGPPDEARAPALREPPVAQQPPATDSGDIVPADWQVLRDEDYGFEIWYPADWAAVDIALRNPELDAPMVRLVQILPAESAAKMNAGGPPDPNNSIVAPISLEVSVGTLQDYRRLYYEMPLVKELEIGGASVTLEQDEPGDYQVSRYIFQHPADSDLRITLVDYISGFSDRAEGNEAIVDTMNRIVATFSFTD